MALPATVTDQDSRTPTRTTTLRRSLTTWADAGWIAAEVAGQLWDLGDPDRAERLERAAGALALAGRDAAAILGAADLAERFHRLALTVGAI